MCLSAAWAGMGNPLWPSYIARFAKLYAHTYALRPASFFSEGRLS